MRILDLCCGAGGASFGYHLVFPDAEIVGVDIAPQPRYPFTFHQGDALSWSLDGYDLIHASPPCQASTTMSNRWRGQGGVADSHENMIHAIRWRLVMAGAAYVIENVPGARRHLHDPVTLSGGMFSLDVNRPRLFETSFLVERPHCVKVVDPVGVYGKRPDGRRLWTRTDGTSQRAAHTLEEGRRAMGIDWMEWRELAEALPPAYTCYIGEWFALTLEAAA